jgi:hypothetical protein
LKGPTSPSSIRYWPAIHADIKAHSHKPATASAVAALTDRYQRSGRTQPRLLKPFTRRIVKQHRISLRIPDCDKSDATRSVQAEIPAARSPAAQQLPFRHLEGADLQLILVAQGLVNILPQFRQIVDLYGLRHNKNNLPKAILCPPQMINRKAKEYEQTKDKEDYRYFVPSS